MFVVGKILWITLYYLIYDWILIIIRSFAVAFCKKIELYEFAARYDNSTTMTEL
jgi:hypothetical protein